MLQLGYGDANPEKAFEIMRSIQEGIDIEYVGDRSINRAPVKNHGSCFKPGIADKISAIIAADVAAGNKAGPFDHPPFDPMSISPLGAVPKAGTDKIRLIHDLSYPRGGDSINEHIVDLSYHNSRFDDAADIVSKLGKGTLLVKLDVAAAYKVIVVRPEDYPLLGFKWLSKYYHDCTLPFGLRSSCRKWELFAAAIHYFLVVNGKIPYVEHYVDDFIIIIPPESETPSPSHSDTSSSSSSSSPPPPPPDPPPTTAKEYRDRALAMCKALGVPMEPKKTEGPTTCLIYLGIELDSIAMEARLGVKRMDALRSLLSIWGAKTDATLHELQCLIGILSFASQVIRPGRTYLRRIIDFSIVVKQMSTSTHQFSPSLSVPIPDSVRDDIDWWTTFITDFNGITLLLEPTWVTSAHLDMYTDACLAGYGAVYKSQWMQGEWSPSQLRTAFRNSSVSMPYLELLALTFGVIAFGHNWSGQRIIFRCDCLPVVQALADTLRTSHCKLMMHLIRILTMTAARYRFDFRVVHIPGVNNTVADLLSRSDFIALANYCRLAQLHLDPLPTPTPPLPHLRPPRSSSDTQ